MELAPCVWFWPQNLLRRFLRHFEPGSYVWDGDQISQTHHKLIPRGAITLPGAPWSLALIFLRVVRMTRPLIPLSRRRLHYPLRLYPCLGARFSWGHISSLLGDLALGGDVSHSTSPDFGERGGVAPDERLTKRPRQHALFEGVHEHLFVLSWQTDYSSSESVQEILQGLPLVLPYIKQVVRHQRWRLVHYVLLNKHLGKLLERGNVASGYTDEPVQRRSAQSAHEHLTIHRV